MTGGGASAQKTQFQSTLLMRGATWYALDKRYLFMISIHAPHARSDLSSRSSLTRTSNFNPRSSCEERHDEQPEKQLRPRPISIHAPHARSDQTAQPQRWQQPYFNPRSSCEERLDAILLVQAEDRISIHAPHARSDSRISACWYMAVYFNPRSSCEERHASICTYPLSEVDFNPCSSCEERPDGTEWKTEDSQISIHAPHARSDHHG